MGSENAKIRQLTKSDASRLIAPFFLYICSMVKQGDIMPKRFDSLRFAKASHVIVKYPLEYNDDKGCYQKYDRILSNRSLL